MSLLNRDSWTWTVAAFVALIGYLQTKSGPPQTWTYVEWLNFLAFVGVWLSGKMDVSPRPGSSNPKQLQGNYQGGPRTWLLPLLMVGAMSAGVSSCATAAAGVKPNPAVSEQQAARNEGAVLAKATKQALDFAVEARRRAQSFYDAGSLSAEKMVAINVAAQELGEKSLAFIAFAKTVTTNASLKATATALYKLFGDFIAKLKLEGWSGDVIDAALDAFRVYLGVK